MCNKASWKHNLIVKRLMLKSFLSIKQQYVNGERQDVQAGFRKDRGTRDQIANIRWIIKKATEFQKKHLLLFYWLYQSGTQQTMWLTTNCGKFFEMGITDHFTCLLRNLYADQEATVITRHGTTDWFQIGKGKLYIVILLI